VKGTGDFDGTANPTFLAERQWPDANLADDGTSVVSTANVGRPIHLACEEPKTSTVMVRPNRLQGDPVSRSSGL